MRCSTLGLDRAGRHRRKRARAERPSTWLRLSPAAARARKFWRIGSRYVLALGPFNALAQARFRASQGASEQLMGETQRAWFLDTTESPDARIFKIWGNEVLPDAEAHRPHVGHAGARCTAPEDHAFGGRLGRLSRTSAAALPTELALLTNVVIVSGDLHCFFAGTPYAGDDPSQSASWSS